MAGKKGKRIKHIPQRTCVGCREVQPKRQLIRIVRDESGVRVDLTGKMKGRGAYLHDIRSCWEKGLKNSLSNALRTTISEQDLKGLKAFMLNLKDEYYDPVKQVAKSNDDGNA